MPPKKSTTKPTGKTQIAATKHKDKRKNIPTEELSDFMTDEQKRETKLLYPRDTSLDPQLVWKGKDELDAQPLEVPSVPIYIQEKIHPQAIIEDLRAWTAAGKPEELQLFSDFNGIQFEDMIDFYHHEQNWSNRMILGDSLLVMGSLAEREGLKGKVQMIYIDPPYGIKFGSNWQVSTRKRDVKDGSVESATRQPEQVKAFRDTWELGIHSYLTYLRDRLVMARELLTESGSVFVQMNDVNLHHVHELMDEVFGQRNLVSIVSFATTTGFQSTALPRAGDYLLWYAKEASKFKYRPLKVESRKPFEHGYRFIRYTDGSLKALSSKHLNGDIAIPEDGVIYSPDNIRSQGVTQGSQDFSFHGRRFLPGANSHWKTNVAGMNVLARASRIHEAANSVQYVRLITDSWGKELNNTWTDTITGQFTDDKIFVVQTNTKVVERCLLMTTDPGDLVLDPTCGSGTTAYVAEQWGRRWITIDTSRVALALARTRLMAGRFPYYLLEDSEEGAMQEAVITGRPPSQAKYDGDVRKGFVCKRVPHITLKSIANNEEIDVIHEKWQKKLEPLRKELNSALHKKWEEWEIPREADGNWDKAVKQAHAKWWEYRRARQKEIDDSIARRADVEYLYDQPYEGKRTRVTGPFTVESLSPHRQLSVKEKKAFERRLGIKMEFHGADEFAQMILENLKRSGVKGQYKDDRIKFTRLDVFPGNYVHGEGEYLDSKGKSRRVAVCVGPEYGTVDGDLIREAAKEAVKGVGFDILLVCGFAFDPHISQEKKEYGKLVVLPTRMNPDLSMGDDLLKKTGAGNLFTVFGEPDIVIRKAKDGQVEVEIKGLDVYDPTTGEIRNNTTDDIACWFIDTNYNGESFFVRHAYFIGEGDPYKKLKTALKAEIDQDAWETLNSTISRPFDSPKTGKIAVKVINHFGDEVLQVYDVKKNGSK